MKGEVEPMRNALRRRFWFETGMAIVTGILFVITLVQRNWIEILFKVDPDSSSGVVEWLIVGVLFVVTLTLFALANYEWRKARAAIS
jgi:tetrahydromethanopterin S-methyltransferase subunit E